MTLTSRLARTLLVLSLVLGTQAACNSDDDEQLAYVASSPTFTKGVAITPDAPTSSSSKFDIYAVVPSLPLGLTIDGTTGIISGTPSQITPSAVYTVTGTSLSAGQSANATLTIAVNDQAPAFSYPDTLVFTRGQGVTVDPTSTGGVVVSYSIAPALPAGLTLNPATGVIEGTPSADAAQATYVVTGTNTGGSATATFTLAVNDIPPSGLSYAESPYVFTLGSAIPPIGPTQSGGPITSAQVAPALPTGLTLSDAGVITGTPTQISSTTTYTVTAGNSGGTTTGTLVITVNDVAPSGLSYVPNPASLAKNSPIVFTKTISGGAVVSYSVTPVLPVGLGLNTTTGELSGTPTVITPANIYTIIATNSGGSTSALVVIAVNDAVPAGLAYSSASYTFTRGQAVSIPAPTSTGGAIGGYTISPALPAGVTFNPVTGAITGSDTSLLTATAYTVTATNISGSTTASFTLTIVDVPPASLSYAASPLTVPPGAAIAPIAPTSSGGAVISYSVSPALPAGLSLNPTTGVISGTPTASTAQATYTVTATNSGGSSTFGLVITVAIAPPTNLAYASPSITTDVGVAIAADAPSSSGGAPTTYAVSPALPAGLTLDPNAGTIAGTPTATSATASYTITASNGGGSTTASVSISVLAQPSFVDQPQSETVNLGATATFGAEVQGSSALTYQWTRNGAAISGATSATYTTAATVAADDQAQFVLVATDANGGAVSSRAAILTVLQNIVGAAPSMLSARAGHTATLLPDGRVLIVGGGSGAATTAELYDPVANSFSATLNNPPSPHAFSQATLLGDNTVLICGGYDPATGAEDSDSMNCDLFDPTTGLFSAATPTNEDRYGYSFVTLPNGNALAIGGINNGSGVADAEEYDLTAKTWTLLQSTMAAPMLGQQSIVVPGGDVITLGGGYTTTLVSEFNPSSSLFTSLAPLSQAREFGAATLLQDGTILVAGGETQGPPSTLAEAEVYSAAANGGMGQDTVVGSMSTDRSYFYNAVTLQSGKAAVIGGYGVAAGGAIGPIDVYDPVHQTFSTPYSLATPRAAQTSTVLNNGKVLICGGLDFNGNTFSSCEFIE